MGDLVFEWRSGAILLAAAVFAFPAIAVEANGTCADAPDFAFANGLGLACAADGGHWILLDDGSRLFTHGFDPLPPSPVSEPYDDGPLVNAFSPPLAPPCVANPNTEFHNFVLYTRPKNKPDRYAEMAPLIRSMVAQANNHLRNEGALSGETWASYKFRCASAEVEVGNLSLNTNSGSDNFGSLVNDVRALGFTSSFAHYWIWHDDGLQEGAAGIGQIFFDDQPNANNANNFGPRYAATLGILGTDGASGAFVMMHENGHNMGAVQTSAPFSSQLGHCNDDNDVMCYVEMVGLDAAPVCLDHTYFDCNYNDYFDTLASPVLYLSNHWNIGARYNRFLAFSDAANLPRRPVMDGLANGPDAYDVTVTWTAPSDLRGGTLSGFRVYGGSAPHALAFLAEVPANATSFIDQDAPGGRDRTYRVSAVTNNGEGSPSAATSIAMPPAQPVAPTPGMPLGVLATPSGAGTVSVQWQPPASLDGTAVTGYRVLRSNGTFGGNFERADVPATQLSYTDTVPATGTYGYSVVAYNDAGDGDPSAKVTVFALGP